MYRVLRTFLEQRPQLLWSNKGRAHARVRADSRPQLLWSNKGSQEPHIGLETARQAAILRGPRRTAIDGERVGLPTFTKSDLFTKIANRCEVFRGFVLELSCPNYAATMLVW